MPRVRCERNALQSGPSTPPSAPKKPHDPATAQPAAVGTPRGDMSAAAVSVSC